MKLRAVSLLAVVAGLLVSAAGCASTSEGDATRRDSSVLTAEEMVGAPVSNLYEAVEQLRPRWLQIRMRRSLTMESEVSVFMNRNYLGGPQELRALGLTGVVRLRYLDGSLASATLRVPDGKHIEGAIVVETGGGE
jgi:hypothetical protein